MDPAVAATRAVIEQRPRLTNASLTTRKGADGIIEVLILPKNSKEEQHLANYSIASGTVSFLLTYGSGDLPLY